MAPEPQNSSQNLEEIEYFQQTKYQNTVETSNYLLSENQLPDCRNFSVDSGISPGGNLTEFAKDTYEEGRK